MLLDVPSGVDNGRNCSLFRNVCVSCSRSITTILKCRNIYAQIPHHPRLSYRAASLRPAFYRTRSPPPPDVFYVSHQSEISAKADPARPGETLSKLLRGELGAAYEPAIGVLWEADGGEPYTCSLGVPRGCAQRGLEHLR